MFYGLILAVSFLNALAAEPVCPKCEVIREYNKEHPGAFEYFDDYQKSLKQDDSPDEKAQ